jgi:hypothetical protein
MPDDDWTQIGLVADGDGNRLQVGTSGGKAWVLFGAWDDEEEEWPGVELDAAALDQFREYLDRAAMPGQGADRG